MSENWKNLNWLVVDADFRRKDEIIKEFITKNRNLKMAANALLWEIINRDSDLSDSDAFKVLKDLIDEK